MDASFIMTTFSQLIPSYCLNHNNSPTKGLPSLGIFIIHQTMDIDSVRCECCGLREDCTQDYISTVKSNFEGVWLCGLCSEAVKDELVSKGKKNYGLEDAMKAHMSFCRRIKSNPAVRVADGMRQILRRKSGELSKPASVS